MTAYHWLLVYILLASALAFVLFAVSYMVILKQYDIEKLSAYECGFDPFSNARGSFDVKFYLVSILFIIFDIELSFLYPWAITVPSQGLLGVSSMFAFIFILTVGFIVEWVEGAPNGDEGCVRDY